MELKQSSPALFHLSWQKINQLLPCPNHTDISLSILRLYTVNIDDDLTNPKNSIHVPCILIIQTHWTKSHCRRLHRPLIFHFLFVLRVKALFLLTAHWYVFQYVLKESVDVLSSSDGLLCEEWTATIYNTKHNFMSFIPVYPVFQDVGGVLELAQPNHTVAWPFTNGWLNYKKISGSLLE